MDGDVVEPSATTGGSRRTATALGAAVLAWGLLLAVVTFARWPALSWSVGATCLGTVYQAVNAVPTVLFDLAAGGALASVSIPMLVGALGHGRPRDVARLGSAVLTWTVVVLGACSVAVGLAAAPLAGVLVGESGCTGAVDVAADLLRWFAPQPVLLGAGVVLGGILRAHGRPLAAVVGPALGSLVVVGSLVWFHQLAAVSDATGVPEGHLAVLAGGTTLAALVVAAVPAVLLWRTGVALRPAVRAPVAAGRRDPWSGAGPGAHRPRTGLRHGGRRSSVTFRSGVGVLPVLAYLQGVLLGPVCGVAAARGVRRPAPARRGAHGPGRAGDTATATPVDNEVPAGPEAHVEPEAQADPEATTVLTRSARHRQRTVGRRAGRAGPGGDRPRSGGRVGSGGSRDPRRRILHRARRGAGDHPGPRGARRAGPGALGGRAEPAAAGPRRRAVRPPSTSAAGRSSREEPSRPRA